MRMMQSRTPLGRAIGLGSAKDGVEHWWRQRVSAVALVPVTVWFTGAILMHARDNYADLKVWLEAPVVTGVMTLLLIFLFYHTALGLQVVIEDYVHSRIKIAALVAVRLGCVALAVAGILATLSIALHA